MKLSNLTEEGILTLFAGVLGIITLLILFGCASGDSIMTCDNLLAEEKDACLEEIRIRNDNMRYQMETRGTMR